MRWLWPFLLVLCVFLGSRAEGQPDTPLSRCRQMVLVVTPDWFADHGILQRFERVTLDGPWKPVGDCCNTIIGRSGMAWDDSQDYPLPLGGKIPIKREGDGCSPAGVFGLPRLFGKPNFRRTDYPFLVVGPTFAGVDDVKSRYYNQIVDASKVTRDWSSSEKMWIDIYDLGILVDYNLHPTKPGRGSCIFVHRAYQDEATAGCTSMDKDHLQQLCSWLQEASHPLLVQLPRSVYSGVETRWNLPDIRSIKKSLKTIP